MPNPKRVESIKPRSIRPDERIVMAWPHPGEVSGQFMDSVCMTQMQEIRPDGLMGVGGGYINFQSGPRIAEIRCQIVETFLTSPSYTEAEWLLMIDSDMIFTPKDVRDIVAAAHRDHRPIVGGLCYAGYSPATMYPTLYAMVDEDGGWALEKVADFPDNAMVKVGATGAAFLLAHRSVLIKMYKAFQYLPSGILNSYPWFVEGHVDSKGRQLGEDVAFCIRAQGMGIPVYVHTGIKIGHRKNIILNEEVWLEQQALRKLKAQED